MRSKRFMAGMGLAVTAVILLASCQTPRKASRTEQAVSPQEQARRDQLAAMSEADAEAAADSTAPDPKRPTPLRDRRAGQGAIDQPPR